MDGNYKAMELSAETYFINLAFEEMGIIVALILLGNIIGAVWC